MRGFTNQNNPTGRPSFLYMEPVTCKMLINGGVNILGNICSIIYWSIKVIPYSIWTIGLVQAMEGTGEPGSIGIWAERTCPTILTVRNGWHRITPLTLPKSGYTADPMADSLPSWPNSPHRVCSQQGQLFVR